MTIDQGVVFAVLAVALILFITERWRYDIVALLALLAVTLSGIVPAEKAFLGFGHAAVATVAAVLVIGRGLQNAGLVDLLARLVMKVGDRPVLQIIALTLVVATLSAFMNNVGALALLLPMTLRLARKGGNPPSLLLMPLAFGSLLGGMTTLIGTPPNIIIASFRTQAGAAPFRMFDFAPVGIGVTLAGIAYMSLIGWRLLPARKGQRSQEDLFDVKAYLTEIRVPENCKLAGEPLYKVLEASEHEIVVAGLVRGTRKLMGPSVFETLQPDDVLIVEADSESLKGFLDATELELAADKQVGGVELDSEETSVMEAILRPGSALEGNTVWTFNLRWRYGINLLGIARQGERLRKRLKEIRFRAGDVLLVQGRRDTLYESLAQLGCLPLAERGLRFGPKRLVLALALFLSAIGAMTAGVAPASLALLAVAVAMILFRLITVREAYDSIEWPVLVLLGAMIPVGEALESTGGAALIAEQLLKVAAALSPTMTLGMVLLGAMLLTPLLNNAAAAILLAPIAIGIARGIGASPDPFLMAVCVGASCDFLTPIGHQSNTLVMGPGGYRFSDYPRMGFPLEILILLVTIPLILYFWPLGL